MIRGIVLNTLGPQAWAMAGVDPERMDLERKRPVRSPNELQARA